MTRETFLAALAAWVARILFKTLRLSVVDRSGFLSNPLAAPSIITFWHNRIPAIAVGFLRKYHHRQRKGVVVLTSPSKDGDILSGVMARLGMGSVRGSSSRRGSTALRELSLKIEEGYDLAVTPDGPRGPKYCLGPGVIYLAQKTGAPILPLHARYHHAFRLKTWDSFSIPFPFSRVDIILDPSITIDPSLLDLEPERLKLEQLLKTNAQHFDDPS
jgi:lysophospholipid acyltransferase (LPLAT)-like uncharacterized protein